MKQLMVVVMVAISLSSSGCMSPTKLVSALTKDPATVHVSIRSIYVTIEVDRTNPLTNTIPHTVKDGDISVGK